MIVTNYAYMMTTLEYNYVMSHFREVMGGDLCDNDRNLFNAENTRRRRNASNQKRHSAWDRAVQPMADWEVDTFGQ